MAYVDDVDTHIRDDFQQTHQFSWTIRQERMYDEVAPGGCEAVLDKAAHEINIDVATRQWHEHFFAF